MCSSIYWLNISSNLYSPYNLKIINYVKKLVLLGNFTWFSLSVWGCSLEQILESEEQR